MSNTVSMILMTTKYLENLNRDSPLSQYSFAKILFAPGSPHDFKMPFEQLFLMTPYHLCTECTATHEMYCVLYEYIICIRITVDFALNELKVIRVFIQPCLTLYGFPGSLLSHTLAVCSAAIIVCVCHSSFDNDPFTHKDSVLIRSLHAVEWKSPYTILTAADDFGFQMLIKISVSTIEIAKVEELS